MPTILIANPKGGSGKTTLATNIAGWLAGKRRRVALSDHDPQRSSTQWLARRPALFPAIAGFGPDAGRKEIKEIDPEWLVIDSPAGLHGEELRAAIKAADLLLVPVSPSHFDMAATARFLATINEYKSVKAGDLPVGLVAIRVDSRTLAAGELDAFIGESGYPLVAHLRDTQVYVHCARDGASVFDLPRSRAEHDWEQWRPLTRWISRQGAPRSQ